MNDADIYRKTDKGRTEVSTRAAGLGLRERAMLIMVDDRTPRLTLLARSAHPGAAAVLDVLLEQGFIEAVRPAVAAAAPAQERIAARPAPSAATQPVRAALPRNYF